MNAVQRVARESGRSLSLLSRMATASLRGLPDVYILGGTKCGTTTLAHMLWQHPAHVAPLEKELMYLQQLPGFISNYERSRWLSLLWRRHRGGHGTCSVNGYRKFFPLRATMLIRRALSGHAITSDCDPFNLYCAVAARRVAQLNPEVRFIVSLRDPVARAFSDYNMHRTRVGERRSFAAMVERELNGEESRFRKRFLTQSMYAEHLQRWFEVFPVERFLVVQAEHLFADSRAAARQMFAFLGLPPFEVRPIAANAGSYSTCLDPSLVRRLRAFFEPHNSRLYALIGRDMQWR